MPNNDNIVFEVAKFGTYTDEVLHTKNFQILHQDGDIWTVTLNNKKYQARVKAFDTKTKTYTINVSGFDYHVKVKERIDRLIDELGFLTIQKNSVKEIKSPMPGLVVQIFVEVGQEVNEGDKLLSLEAMKMENILKSPGSGVIKSISANKGSTVDKNQILISFE
jgi:biotin carboxyl carrier protein